MAGSNIKKKKERKILIKSSKKKPSRNNKKRKKNERKGKFVAKNEGKHSTNLVPTKVFQKWAEKLKRIV